MKALEDILTHVTELVEALMNIILTLNNSLAIRHSLLQTFHFKEVHKITDYYVQADIESTDLQFTLQQIRSPLLRTL